MNTACWLHGAYNYLAIFPLIFIAPIDFIAYTSAQNIVYTWLVIEKMIFLRLSSS